MIKKTLFLLPVFFVLAGCAGREKGRTAADIMAVEQAKVRKIQVANRDEARKVMSNHLNFLKLQFEQSYDPYYGKPRWPEGCLQVNQVGDIIDSVKSLQSLSNLLLDRNGHAGHCLETESIKKSHLIYLWCESSTELIELKIPIEAVEDLSLPILCP
jgi:hypothetical protein